MNWMFKTELFLERHWRGLLYCLFLVWCFYAAMTSGPEPMPEWYYRDDCDDVGDC